MPTRQTLYHQIVVNLVWSRPHKYGYAVEARICWHSKGACILLGLFWLFLFWFRNNRIHGISISKRTLLHASDLETESEVTWELLYLRMHLTGGRVGFPAKNFPKERVFCLFRVNCIPSILFILLSGAEWTEWYSIQKNTNTVYSEYSYSGIVPKERALREQKMCPVTMAGRRVPSLFGRFTSRILSRGSQVKPSIYKSVCQPFDSQEWSVYKCSLHFG